MPVLVEGEAQSLASSGELEVNGPDHTPRFSANPTTMLTKECSGRPTKLV